jgi:hypothetical protein
MKALAKYTTALIFVLLGATSCARQETDLYIHLPEDQKEADLKEMDDFKESTDLDEELPTYPEITIAIRMIKEKPPISNDTSDFGENNEFK